MTHGQWRGIVEEYRERLMSKGSNAAYNIMRTVIREARRDPRRIVYPHAGNPRLLRAIQQIVDEGIAKPVLLGRASAPGRWPDTGGP